MCLTVLLSFFRFFIAINGSKPEIVQLEYKADGGIKTYYKRSFSDTSLWNSNLRKGIELWKDSLERRNLMGYQYEVNPERCDPTKFNLLTARCP